MNSIIITPMLDEEDGTPVYQVADENGNATNVTELATALELAKTWIKPVKMLEEMATDWIVAHGSNILDDMRDDVESEFEIKFTEDQWDSFCNMLAYAKITVEFPFGWGVPPTD